MARPKGPGAIKFLDSKEQDDVAMRRILWNGAPPSETEKALAQLRATKADLIRKQLDLRTCERQWSKVVKATKADLTGNKSISQVRDTQADNPMQAVVAKTKLADARSELDAVNARLGD